MGSEVEKMPEKVDRLGSIRNFFRHYAEFRGRSSRSEYWYVQTFAFLAYLGFLLASIAFEGDRLDLTVVGIVLLSVGLGSIVSNISVHVRRLRDAGLSPFLLLSAFFQSSAV